MFNDILADGHAIAVELCADFHNFSSVGRVGQGVVVAVDLVDGFSGGTGMAFDPAFYYYRPVNVYAAHGYGPAILAGAEVIQLLNSHTIRMNDSAVHFYRNPPKSTEPIFYVDEE